MLKQWRFRLLQRFLPRLLGAGVSALLARVFFLRLGGDSDSDEVKLPALSS